MAEVDMNSTEEGIFQERISLIDIMVSEDNLISNLYNELEGTLLCIIGAGKTSKKFIESRQKYFRKYIPLVDNLISPLGYALALGFDEFIDNMPLEKGLYSEQAVIEKANEILWEYLSME